MVLRKVKSAPANICEMVNRCKIKKSTIENPILPVFKSNLGEIDDIDTIENFNKKDKEKSLKFFGNILNEIILEDKNPESKEYLILNFIIPYFENNIINKKFITNLFNSLLTYLAKTLIIFIFHHLNNQNFEFLDYFIYVEEMIDKIINKETSI